MRPGSILTASGRRVCPFDLAVEDVVLEDLAHALAHLPRWGGHAARFYSVAQHAFLASAYVHHPDPRVRLYALHHDDSEAYLLDLPAPLKQLPGFKAYRLAERSVQATCYRAVGLDPYAVPLAVKDIDLRLRATEQRDLNPCWPAPEDVLPLVDVRINPWPPELARELFIARHHELVAAMAVETAGCRVTAN